MQIELEGRIIDVHITKKNNKNMYLRVKEDGIHISCIRLNTFHEAYLSIKQAGARDILPKTLKVFLAFLVLAEYPKRYSRIVTQKPFGEYSQTNMAKEVNHFCSYSIFSHSFFKR